MLKNLIRALPPLREIIGAHGLKAQKSLGQNFLFDLNLTQKIARSAGDMSTTTVIEVGPGPGGLTRALLLEGAQKVIAIEQDQRAVEALHSLATVSGPHLQVIYGDALQFDYSTIQGPKKIVANLPYNISTVLLINWLRQSFLFQSMTLMFQKEVAARLVASVGSSAYGRLSVMTQWRARVRRCFDIPPKAFIPAPKIISTVVHIEPYSCEDLSVSFEALEQVTKAAFGQRRKMLRSSLKELWGARTLDKIQQANLDPTLRAEELNIQDFVTLAKLHQNR